MTTFDQQFKSLTGNEPLPWQRRLYQRLIAGDVPKVCDLPTGLGKTSIIPIWLLALARRPSLPRRLVYVVNRRTVVDQATTESERVAARLLLPELASLREALRTLSATPIAEEQSPVAISTLRGQRADNAEWRRDPCRPAIVIGTVDMIGSRLLFSGYGRGYKTKPLHAGFLGQDSLLVHDEAHLEPAFQALLNALHDEQVGDLRRMQVTALTATSREAADFSLDQADKDHPVVARRLNALKGIRVTELSKSSDIPRIATKVAREYSGKVLVFLSSVEHVEAVARALEKEGASLIVLTGTMRGKERDQLVHDQIFARFLPRPPAGVVPKQGTVFLVATSAGEVGIDISADHLVTDLPPFDALAQRLGRVNRYGEGNAEVELLTEVSAESMEELHPGDAAPVAVGGEDGADSAERDEKSFERARRLTRGVVDALPLRADGRRDASPLALRALSLAARVAASTPMPKVRAVDPFLLDRWSFTTIKRRLPGRPRVADWLHGVAEWEPPRTTIAWRDEVSWLSEDHLGTSSLEDFLADYPLLPRECLSDRTDRVHEHLKVMAERSAPANIRVWLVNEEGATFEDLATLVARHDPRRDPALANATIVLPPSAGGLRGGLLDSSVTPERVDADEASVDPEYDVGAVEGERIVVEREEVEQLNGMRLLRSILRQGADENDVLWQLFVRTQSADADGARSGSKPQLLTDHLVSAERWARRVADHLNLDVVERNALVLAARWHDLGKSRRIWQRSIRRFEGPPLAKGPMVPAELASFRHEFGSLHDVQREDAFADLAREEQDLVLHLIAAHHGRARPHFPPAEAYDPDAADDASARTADDVPLRFERLQRRYGRWGLAWLESLLRAVDVLASEDSDLGERHDGHGIVVDGGSRS